MIKHSVFTPIFNRADLLKDLYGHMLEIDYPRNDWEWLIIDDGSTDNIADVVSEFDLSKINIRIFHKKNGGIHTAQNFAVQHACGQFITRIDSDDYLLPDALKMMDYYYDQIPELQRDSVVGVVGLCLNLKDFSIRGTSFAQDSIISKGYIERKKGSTGDKNYCMKTEIMKEFLIPELPDTKWVPEGIIWNRIDRAYNTLFVNHAFSVCSEPNESSMLGSMAAKGKTRSVSACMSTYYGSVYGLNESWDIFDTKMRIQKFVAIWLNTFSCSKLSIRRTGVLS
jgi:glycosyltransferase involved in cell wall biosynthesis